MSLVQISRIFVIHLELSTFQNSLTNVHSSLSMNKTVRAINVHAKTFKGQHEKLLKFAQSIGMGGLGYLEVQRRTEIQRTY